VVRKLVYVHVLRNIFQEVDVSVPAEGLVGLALLSTIGV
jgi:hypothetical protein